MKCVQEVMQMQQLLGALGHGLNHKVKPVSNLSQQRAGETDLEMEIDIYYVAGYVKDTLAVLVQLSCFLTQLAMASTT
jgi:hypothetical protein